MSSQFRIMPCLGHFLLLLVTFFFGITFGFAQQPEDSQCLKLVKEQFSFISLWGLQMVDASAKIPSGLLNGHVLDLGDFDLCIATKGTASDNTAVRGKYCVTSASAQSRAPSSRQNFSAGPGAEMRLQLAVCLPDACSAQEANSAWNQVVNEKQLLANLSYVFVEDYCQTIDDKQVDLGADDIGFICLTAILLSLVVASSAYDAFMRYSKKEKGSKILTSFSVIENGQKLLHVSNDSNQLRCLDGIRVISMAWVILGHRYTSTNVLPPINGIDVFNWMLEAKNFYIIGASVSVDSFFLIGGLLTSYTFFRVMSKGHKFNVFKFYLHRYLRLTPLLAYLVFFSFTMAPEIGSGPVWKSMSDLAFGAFCKEYWWSTLLHVQNIANVKGMCLGQTWYLSVDFQTYLVSPLVLYSLYKWPKVGKFLLGFVLAMGVLAPMAVSWARDLPGLPMLTLSLEDYLKYYYYATYSRFGPIAIGIAFGYLIYCTKQNTKLVDKIPMKRPLNIVLWLVSLGLLNIVVWAPYKMLGREINTIEGAIFNGFHRNVWALALGYIIFACVHGYGGVVNALLSHPVFQVLSKLSYCMYLVHLLVIYSILSVDRSVAYFSDSLQMHKFWGDFMFSAFWSVPFVLLVELPFSNLQRILLQ